MITKAKFEEAYNTILRESKPILEAYKKEAIHENTKTVVTVIAIIILGMGLGLMMNQPVFLAITVLLVLIYITKSAFTKKPSASLQYKKEYKERVINKLLSYFNERLDYEPHGGISSSTYYSAGFNTYDRYRSEDFIRGKIEEQFPFSMSELLIQSQHTDDKGRTTYVTEFMGLFAMVENDKDIGSIIYIRKDKKFVKISKLRGIPLVKLDSPEFEKTFDIYSNNNVVTVQILTSEIMQMLNDMYKKMNYEISIINNKVFMRFSLKKNLFEASYKKEIIKKENLYEYCQIINFVMELFLKLHQAIEESQI
ncbi:MAG: DUF3137 domain-containing protein [Clostridia bacterium]|nr:DUF3137 domain-containing protein [Clostridia bacterium]